MLRYCLDCTTAFAVDLPRCPHCRSTRSGYSTPERQTVPKATDPRKVKP